MSGTALNDSIDGLITTWQGKVEGLRVVDGPFYDATAGTGFLCVAWHGPDELAVQREGRIARDAGRRSDQERLNISCLLTKHLGDASTVTSARQWAVNAYEALADLLDADKTLGGKVVRSEMGDYGYSPVRLDEGGALVALRFEVEVIAWK